MRFLQLIMLWLLLLQGAAADRTLTLAYDDGVPEDGLWVDESRGHGVLFTPPTYNWTLSKVAVSGMLNQGKGQGTFVLEIWDRDLNLLYRTADLSRSYFGEDMKWAEIDIPDLQIYGDFLVCFFEASGIYVGVDLGNQSFGRSFVVARNPNRIDPWDLQVPQNRSDWTIAAVGYSDTPRPEVKASSTSTAQWVSVVAEALDPDGNLARATLNVVDNRSLETVWSEQASLEASSSKAAFEWQRESFRISNGTSTVEPVYAVRITGVSDEEAPYLAYSAPCLFSPSTEGPEVAALAYFGLDGEFHALVDLLGQTHYSSQELLQVVSPDTSYGAYSKNITARAGQASLSFYRMILGGLMVPHSPLVLERSPIHHYMLRLEKVKAPAGEYLFLVEVEDSQGNVARALA